MPTYQERRRKLLGAPNPASADEVGVSVSPTEEAEVSGYQARRLKLLGRANPAQETPPTPSKEPVGFTPSVTPQTDTLLSKGPTSAVPADNPLRLVERPVYQEGQKPSVLPKRDRLAELIAEKNPSSMEEFRAMLDSETEAARARGEIKPPEPAAPDASFGEKFSRSLQAGAAGTLSRVGRVAELVGDKEFGQDLREGFGAAAEANRAGIKQEEFKGFESLLNPDFWATTGAEGLGNVAALAPLGLVGGATGAAAAGAAGAGALGTTLATAGGATAFSRPVESAIEAADAYESMLAEGKSEAEASNAAKKVFAGNLALAPMDVGELLLALTPVRGTRIGKVMAKVMKAPVAKGVALAGSAVGEGAEEVIQTGIQRVGQGKSLTENPEEYKQAFGAGLAIGLPFAGAAALTQAGSRTPAQQVTPQPTQPITPQVQAQPTPQVQTPAPVVEQPAAAPVVEKPKRGKKATPEQRFVTVAEATPQATRVQMLRDANPGMDEGAIQEMVKTTASLSDEEFRGFAERVGKPQETQPETPPAEEQSPEVKAYLKLEDYRKTAKTKPYSLGQPITVYRRDVPDASLTASKPHGLYLSMVYDRDSFNSPHKDAGDSEHWGTANPKKPLVVKGSKIEHLRFGRGRKGDVSAGVGALQQLLPEAEFERVRTMAKGGLAKLLEQRFPGPDYSKYYDSYELLEAYGAQLAREQGHDALILEDSQMPEFSEVVVLDDGAVTFEKSASPKVEPTPAPATPPEGNAFAEGDEVFWTVKGERRQGTIRKVTDELAWVDREGGSGKAADRSQVRVGDLGRVEAKAEPTKAETPVKEEPKKPVKEQSKETPSQKKEQPSKKSEVVKARDTSVRDFPTTATIKDGKVKVVTTVAGMVEAQAEFTVEEWQKAMKKWPNENYAAHEFIRSQHPDYAERSVADGAANYERILDSQIAAVKKALQQIPTPTKEQSEENPAVKERLREKVEEKGKLAFTGERPTFGDSTAPAPIEPVKRREIVKALQEKFNVTIRTGGFRGKALGIFNPKDRVIRTKQAEDILVQAHEVGHDLDEQLNLRGIATDELMELGKPRVSKNASKTLQRREGVAEFMRLYLSKPEEAAEKAPKYYAAFQQRMEANPEIGQALLDVRKLYQGFRNQSGKWRILGSMSTGETTEKPGFFTRLAQSMEEFYTKAVDDQEPLAYITRQLTDDPDGIPVDANPFMLATLARSHEGQSRTILEYGHMDKDFNKVGKSLREVLEPIKERLDDFRAFIVAKRAHELATRKKDQIPPEKSIGAEVSMRDVQEVLDEFAEDTTFVTAQKELVEYNSNLLNLLIEEGIVDAKTAQTIRDLNQDYVPFFRLFDPGLGGVQFKSAKRFANLRNPIYRIKGSGQTMIDPLESIYKNTFTFVRLVRQHQVGRALVELAEKHGKGEFVTEVAQPMRATQIELADVKKALEANGVDTKTINLEQLVTVFKPSFQPKAGSSTIVVFRKETQKDGTVVSRPKFYEVNEAVYNALVNLEPQVVQTWEKIVSYPARLLRLGAILNPDFGARNPVRDNFGAYIQSEYGFTPGVDFARGLFSAVKKDDLYYKFQAAGGLGGTMQSMDREYLQKGLNEVLNDPKKRAALEKLFTPLFHPINTLADISEVGEQATRLGEGKKAVAKLGETREGIQRAALAMLDITTNFSRQGSEARRINRFVAFLTARIGGIDKTVRAFKKHPVRTTARAALSYTLPALILYALNRDNPEYEEKPQWMKDMFMLVPLGNPKSTQYFIPIPRAHFYGIFFGALPERILRWIDKEDPKALDGILMEVIDSLSPTAKETYFLPVPTGLLPAGEAAFNKSTFTGREIVSKRLQGVEPELQYGPTTTEAAKLLGKVGISPLKAEHLVRGYGGGLAMYGLRGIDLMLGLADKGAEKLGKDILTTGERPTMKLGQMPFVRVFVTDRVGSGDSVDRFYDALAEAETLYKSRKARVEQNLSLKPLSERDTILLENISTLRAVQRELQEINSARYQVEMSKEISGEEKRQLIDGLNLNATNLARAVFGKEPVK